MSVNGASLLIFIFSEDIEEGEKWSGVMHLVVMYNFLSFSLFCFLHRRLCHCRCVRDEKHDEERG